MPCVQRCRFCERWVKACYNWSIRRSVTPALKRLVPDTCGSVQSVERALEIDRLAACWRCGSTIGPHEEVMDGCLRCRAISFHFQPRYRLGIYEGLLREVVLRMKQQAGESLAAAMGELFANRFETVFSAAKLDAVIAIPLHWRRRTSRGYNQSESLARATATPIAGALLHDKLIRSRYTKRQVGLLASERRTNVLGAFAARRPGGLARKKGALDG